MRDDERMTCIEGKEVEYEEYVGKNQDGYGNCAVVAGAALGKALDDGLSPEEAKDRMYESEAGQNLTVALAGCVAQAVSHFHPRGEEFRKWWNWYWGAEPEEDSGGVANPSILKIG